MRPPDSSGTEPTTLQIGTSGRTVREWDAQERIEGVSRVHSETAKAAGRVRRLRWRLRVPLPYARSLIAGYIASSSTKNRSSVRSSSSLASRRSHR